MKSYFADALQLLIHGDFGNFEKLLKQHPELLEIKAGKRSLLTFAVLNDRLRPAQYLHKKGFLFFDGDDNGVTAVHWAVLADAEKCLKYILKISQAPHEIPWVLLKDCHGVTPVHLAAKLGRTRILKLLLDAVDDPDRFYEEALDNYKRSALHYAAACGRVACCELLLDCSIQLQPDQRDDNNQTPLMCAAASVYPDGALAITARVVRLLGTRLLQSGKRSLLTARDKDGRTALHLAVLASNDQVIDVLLDELQGLPETFDNEGRTPLHYAAHRGLSGVVKKLIDAKARNVTRDKFGVTPAHYAASEGHLTVLELLLQTRQNLQEVYDKDRRSCLIWAIISGRVEIVKHLLEKFNYDINDKDKYGYTAVHHAAHVGNTQIIKMLFKFRDGCNINSVDNNKATPLHLAAGRGLTDVVRCLITLGAIRESEDFQNRTPVFYACLGGQAHTLKVMLNELDCEPQTTDALGRTALHCAAFAGFVACIEVLIQKSDQLIYAKDNDQLTALHVACLSGKLDCVKILLQYGAPVNTYSALEEVTALDCAFMNGYKQIYDFLRSNGGLLATELKEMAVRIIQRWWRSHRKKKFCRSPRDPSPPRNSTHFRHQRIF
ncbi:unnamed protein product [Enterobius vermicularis]|uniref:ANK_REP_REGION domain-containing protein n=1 Tax=Enterobius vermicularis TaxID=51028 RepID=A0A0N4V0V3_ENTVE|nr:unnamed protein product [Enterobius vermicularis]